MKIRGVSRLPAGSTPLPSRAKPAEAPHSDIISVPGEGEKKRKSCPLPNASTASAARKTRPAPEPRGCAPEGMEGLCTGVDLSRSGIPFPGEVRRCAHLRFDCVVCSWRFGRPLSELEDAPLFVSREIPCHVGAGGRLGLALRGRTITSERAGCRIEEVAVKTVAEVRGLIDEMCEIAGFEKTVTLVQAVIELETQGGNDARSK